MNSLAYYEDSKNRWVSVKPQSKIMPSPRFGLNLFCYYNYLILFGGEGKNGVYFGDLWIYDIVRSSWHKILDSPSGYEIEETSDDKTPYSRSFSGGELLIKYGSALIFGGIGEDNTNYCEIWSLDIERAVNLLEDTSQKEIDKLWKKIPVPKRDKSLICRYGLDTLRIDDTNILLFGGAVSTENKAVLFDIVTAKLTALRNLNEPPRNRFYHDMIDSGNGVVLMYGGEDESGATLSEYLMLKVDVRAQTITYLSYKPKSSYFSMIFAWREGFSLHHSPTLKHPIIIGGGFGNNQQGKALLSLPLVVCANREEFEKGGCTPCPRHSFYNPKSRLCEWCTVEQFFYEDKNDYFNSKCKFCPPGTIGSQAGRCTACLPGYIYDPEVKGSCRICPDDKVCPFATKHAFPRGSFSKKVDSIQYTNSPQMFRGYTSPFDNTTMWVLLSMVSFSRCYNVLKL